MFLAGLDINGKVYEFFNDNYPVFAYSTRRARFQFETWSNCQFHLSVRSAGMCDCHSRFHLGQAPVGAFIPSTNERSPLSIRLDLWETYFGSKVSHTIPL